jgi:hypothetical protein
MNSRVTQWILFAITMTVFSWLTLTARWEWLTVAILASSILWYGIVPRSHSGHNRRRAR